MKKRGIIWYVIILLMLTTAFSRDDIIIIPVPDMIQPGEGLLLIDGPIVSRQYFNQNCPALSREVGEMEYRLNVDGSIWDRTRITYASLESGSGLRMRNICRRYDLQCPVAEESYVLKVTPEEIIIVGADDRGLFYGIQTLKQLVRKKAGKFVIPSVVIYDAPALAFRGIHFFTGNNALEEQKKLINFMAQHKMNHAIIQVDFLEFEQYPEIRHPNFAQTQDEIRELIQYARERFITVTPLVASLGHAEWAFQNDQNLDIAEDPGNPAALNITNPRTYKFLFNIFDEVIDLFEPEYFHIGLDEIDHFGGFPAREESIKYSITEIVDMYMREVGEYFSHRGIDKIMLWGDMFLAPGEAQDATFAETLRDARARRAILPNAMRRQKPSEIIVCDWHYAAVDPEMYTSLDIFHQLGVKTVASTWYNPENIRNFTHQAIADESWGLLQTTWAGYNFFIEENVDCHNQFEAYLLAADYSWSGRTEPSTDLPYNYSSEFWKRWYAPSLSGGAHISYDKVSFHVLQKMFDKDFEITLQPVIEQFSYAADEVAYTCRISLANPVDRPITVIIESEAPVRLSESVSLLPDSRESLTFDFSLPRKELSPARDIPVSFQVQLEGIGEIVINKEIYPTPVWYAVPLDQSLEMDGDISKWEAITPYVFSEERFTAHKEDWSPEDLSVKMFAAYHETDLYFAFEVQDDEHWNEYTSYSIWQGDSLQVGFEFLNKRAPYYSSNDLEMGFALGNDGEIQIHTWVPHMDLTRGLAAVTEYSVTREENITLYEIIIPLSGHDMKEVAHQKKFGFTFAVNDNDGEGFSGGIIGSRGLYDPKNPSQFGTLILLDR